MHLRWFIRCILIYLSQSTKVRFTPSYRVQQLTLRLGPGPARPTRPFFFFLIAEPLSNVEISDTRYIISATMSPKRPHSSNDNLSTISESPSPAKVPEKSAKKKLNTSHKSSWVWQHFITQLDKGSKEKQNICQVPLPSKGGKACGAVITFDQTSSTRSMSQNLECRHNLSQSTVPEAGMMKNFVTNCKMEQVHWCSRSFTFIFPLFFPTILFSP